MGNPGLVRQEDLPGLQYLRGIAALWVVIFHISMQASAAHAGRTIHNLCSGVDIFFVISGFIMVYSTRAGQKNSAGQFLYKRFIRIAPLYWALTIFMIALLMVAPSLVKSSSLTASHAAASLAFVAWLNPATRVTYAPLVTPGWTLNLEAAFYLCFAFGIMFGRGPRSTVALAAALPLIAGLVGSFLDLRGVAGFYTNSMVLEFAFGMVIGYQFLARPIATRPGVAWSLLTATLGILLCMPRFDTIPRGILFGIPAAMVVFAGTLLRQDRVPFLHRLGDMSYSLYLSHFFVLSAVAQVARYLGLLGPRSNMILFYPAAFCLSLLVGYFVWNWIEVPVGRYFATHGRWSGRQARGILRSGPFEQPCQPGGALLPVRD